LKFLFVSTGIISLLLTTAVCAQNPSDTIRYPGEEKHLLNIRMMTNGGENAEAYFSPDGKYFSWQGRWNGNYPADQIWIEPVAGGEPKLVSTGFGKTTCSFFVPGTDKIVWSSTHGFSKEPPKEPDRKLGYVWGLDEYDVFISNRDGSDAVRLTDNPGYDAETAVSPDGKKIVFTSVRNGDLDIYTMDIDGKNVKQLTTTYGYDGGSFFSPDGKWIIFRSHLPKNDEEKARYKSLFDQRLVAPIRFELQIMRPDGSERRQLTDLKVASFAPYVHPNGKKIVFCSNYGPQEPGRRMPVFNIWMMNFDGSELEQVTHGKTFDGFPMFSNDGTKFIWCSNRFGPHTNSTNVFIADWKD
jgi:Tol biopolymer transport system component